MRLGIMNFQKLLGTTGSSNKLCLLTKRWRKSSPGEEGRALISMLSMNGDEALLGAGAGNHYPDFQSLVHGQIET
jgi:hypothetical protein